MKRKKRDQFSYFIFWLLLNRYWINVAHTEIGHFDSNAADKKFHFRLFSLYTRSSFLVRMKNSRGLIIQPMAESPRCTLDIPRCEKSL